jgi:hypothetical protein
VTMVTLYVLFFVEHASAACRDRDAKFTRPLRATGVTSNSAAKTGPDSLRWHSHLVAGSVDADRLLFVRAASEPAPFSASP